MSEYRHQWPSAPNCTDLFRTVANTIDDEKSAVDSFNSEVTVDLSPSGCDVILSKEEEAKRQAEKAERQRLDAGKIIEIFKDGASTQNLFNGILDAYQDAVELAMTKFDTLESFVLEVEKEALNPETADENAKPQSGGAKTYGECYVKGYKRYTKAIAEVTLVDLDSMRKAIAIEREKQTESTHDSNAILASDAHLHVVHSVLETLLKQKNVEHVSGLDRTLLELSPNLFANGKNGLNAAYFPAFMKTMKAIKDTRDGLSIETLMEMPITVRSQDSGEIQETQMTYNGYVQLVAQKSLETQQLSKLKEKLVAEGSESGDKGRFKGKLWDAHLSKIAMMVADLRSKFMKMRL